MKPNTLTPLDSLIALSGRPVLDEAAARDFIAQPGAKVLVFSGIEKKRGEAHDVAVITREFMRMHPGAFEVAVLSGAAEDRIKTAFGVIALPSLVLIGHGPHRVLPRVQDWPVYRDAFQSAFGPPPAIAAE
jgi:Hydrogenase-1 expression protein HyaE